MDSGKVLRKREWNGTLTGEIVGVGLRKEDSGRGPILTEDESVGRERAQNSHWAPGEVRAIRRGAENHIGP